jgi:hypothetical protein
MFSFFGMAWAHSKGARTPAAPLPTPPGPKQVAIRIEVAVSPCPCLGCSSGTLENAARAAVTAGALPAPVFAAVR